jgi:hypothetical protein
MARNGKISARVAEVFRENAGKPVLLKKLVREVVNNPQAISSAITYLRTKYSAGDPTGLPITTLTRGKVWAYYPSEKAEGERVIAPEGVKAGIERMVSKLADAETQEQLRNTRINPPNAETQWAAEELDKTERTLRINAQFAEEIVPTSEPTVTLRVLGTLKETGEVLVLGADEWGFGNDVWAMRRLG